MADSIGSSYLFIDTSVRGQIRLAAIPVDSRRSVEERVSEQSRDLAACAEAFFGPRVRRARGIIVVAGPGSFSAIRSGVLLANMMSRLLKVPLYEVKVETGNSKFHRVKRDQIPNSKQISNDKFQTIERVTRDAAYYEEIRSRILGGDLKPVRYVAPIYDQEPNVTVASSSANRQTPSR